MVHGTVRPAQAKTDKRRVGLERSGLAAITPKDKDTVQDCTVWRSTARATWSDYSGPQAQQAKHLPSPTKINTVRWRKRVHTKPRPNKRYGTHLPWPEGQEGKGQFMLSFHPAKTTNHSRRRIVGSADVQVQSSDRRPKLEHTNYDCSCAQ